MEPIRVLRVITWLPVGGIERKIVEILPRLDRSRLEVSLVTIRERGPLADELEAAGIPVFSIPFRTRWDPSALRRLAALMRERRIDLVHSHMYRSNVPATAAARIAGIRHVWAQVHNVGTWESPRQLALDRFLCRWREGILAVSEEVRRDVIENLRLPPEKVRVLYNGVDLSRFGSTTGREELRRECGVADGDVVFLMAARLVEQKRPHDFFDLAAHLIAQEKARAFPRTHFWFVGDGSMTDDLRARAAQLGVPDRIRFFGRRDDVERFMAAADIFVMPSTKEGFSNALLEAMASGLAIVATRVGGNAEAVRDGIDGLIIPPLDPAALRAAAERILSDSAFRQSLAASARERAREFSLDAMVANVSRLYESSVRGV